MRVIITGSRDWNDPQGIENMLEMLPRSAVILQGMCRGADLMARDMAKKLGYKVEDFPADWENEGRAAGPIRNKWMLDSGCDLVIAFHYALGTSKGTKDMVRKAVAADVPVIYYPFWSKWDD